jgi:hypothetical protein
MLLDSRIQSPIMSENQISSLGEAGPGTIIYYMLR